jgi:acyl-CoA synthetase (AMP-forming)/AMP-acid ligase II
MERTKSLPLTSVEEAARYRKCGIWPDETLFERFERFARQAPDKTAIIDARRQYTYGEFLEAADRLSRGLYAAGIRAGDVVAVQLPNWAEHPLAHLALNRIGALAMPIHDSWREAELPHLLRVSGAVAAIVPSSYRDIDYPALYAGLRERLPKLKQVFSIGAPNHNAAPFEALLSGGEAGPHVEYLHDPDAPGALMLSSGTTSLPKISMYSSNDLLALLAPFWKRIRLTPDDVAAALAPAGTGAIGYVYPILSPLLNGATSVVLERWSEPELAVDLILEHRCTYATGVPTQLTQMLPAIKRHATSEFAMFRCFTNAGAPLPLDVGRQIEEHMGCRIFSIYGATDGGVASCTDLGDTQDQRLKTVGRAQDECEIRLVDALDNPVSPGQAGEIQFRTAGKSYGYLNDPEGTAAAFTSDRFYRTGDLGVLDADGYLRITGRARDMIIRGGRNISPTLIEEMVGKHPAVLEVAVAAFPDATLGERACAFVVLAEGKQLTFPSLLAFLKTLEMPTWQMPERLEIMHELPKSAGGKVMKNKLREYVAAMLQDGPVATAPRAAAARAAS